MRVIINQTLTVDQQLKVATLQETVTVTGDSPIVDTSTTAMGTNFTKELLTEIPNARDVWAAMAQAPGIQMTAFDVGGSNTGNQSGFRSYGFDTQNQTRVEGIDTTEGTAANAGYFDFGSFEEFQVGGAGADSGAFAGGAVLSISVKSGGDRFAGTWYSDYVSESQLTDNVPDYLRTANTPDEDGFFSRCPRPVFRSLRRDDLQRQRHAEAVRPQRRRRRPAVEAEGVVLHQLAPERQVRLHHRPRRRSRSARSSRTSTPSRARSRSARTTRSSAT